MAEAQPAEDDKTISNEVVLWRRIPHKPSHCIYDHNLKRWRPTSAAFKDHPGGSAMSVTIDVGQEPITAIANYPGQYLAAITAGTVRGLGQVVVRKPVPDDANHAEVAGSKPKKVSSDMAKAAKWIVAPPNDLTSRMQ
jgi:hypothetical protein